jgi:hypothetical protein
MQITKHRAAEAAAAVVLETALRTVQELLDRPAEHELSQTDVDWVKHLVNCAVDTAVHARQIYSERGD